MPTPKKQPKQQKPPRQAVHRSEAVIDEIMRLAATGMSLNKICKLHGMPGYATAFGWLNESDEMIRRYRSAREVGFEIWADEIRDIPDEPLDYDMIEALTPVGYMKRQLLRTEARKWTLAKMLPKKYGDKIDLNHGGQDGNPIIHRIERVIVDAIDARHTALESDDEE